VDSEAKLQDCLKDLSNCKQVAFDTETTSIIPTQADLVGISLAGAPKRGYYLPVGHKSGHQLPLETLQKALKPFFENLQIGKVGHNSKYDLVCLHQAGINLAPITFDTMIAEWLINPESRSLGLKAVAWQRLGVEMTHIEELIGKG